MDPLLEWVEQQPDEISHAALDDAPVVREWPDLMKVSKQLWALLGPLCIDFCASP